mgnify:CR=1 FL=1|tara:strand:+ start:9628 stop:10047 length:420 start_codon:yes stop_codon:yes gene_type:complete
MEKLFDWVIEHDEVSILCCPNFKIVNMIKKLGIIVDNINYDINFKDMPNVICNDFVFDNIKLKECVIHYNCEKTYPVGRLHKGVFILRGDDKNHNGDCNPIESVEKLIDDNEITEIFDCQVVKNLNKNYNHYYVYGTNF